MDSVASYDVTQGNLLCRRCGYNLRGLAQNGACPECAELIWLSAQGNMLRFSDPKWLASVAEGIGLNAWGTATLLSPIWFPFMFGCAPFSSIIGGIAAITGIWCATAAEPQRDPGQSQPRQRWLTRLLIVLGSTAPGILWAVGMWGPPQSWLALVSVGPFLALLVAQVLFAQHLKGLVRRIPDPVLVQKAAKLPRLIVGFFLVEATAGAAMISGAIQLRRPTSQTVLIVLGLVLGLVLSASWFQILRLASRSLRAVAGKENPSDLPACASIQRSNQQDVSGQGGPGR